MERGRYLQVAIERLFEGALLFGYPETPGKPVLK